ncbi:MAG: tetratricopeptide repeat protein [Opitutus sp.]
MKGRRIGILLGIGLLLGLGAAALWWQSTTKQLETVAAALPALPDLSSSPPIMREHIETADGRARKRGTSQQGLTEIAQLYHANGFLSEAVACYTGLETFAPAEPRWWHLHATILAGYGEADAALKIWERVASLAPTYIPARLRVADCLLKANRTKDAAEAYAAVLKIDPKQPHALFGVARIEFEAGRLDRARELLENVVNQTNYQLGYDLIVTVYERLGLLDRARAIRGLAAASGAYRDPADPWLDALEDVCFDPFRLCLSAGVAARLGDRAKAQRLLERAVELNPNDVAPRFQLGTLAVEQGNFTVATDQLERCTQLAPDFADGWAHLSSLQEQRGDKAGAQRTLATGLRNCPQSPGLHLMRARSLQKAERPEEAINEFMISARLRPNEPDAYIELANTLFGLERIPEGLEQLKAALNAEPEHPMALSILAFYAITTGDEKGAREWLTRIANQPRISKEGAVRLSTAYTNQFHREWIWPEPR